MWKNSGVSVLSSIHAADGVLLAAGSPAALEAFGAALLVAVPIVLVAWVGLYLWTGFALSRLFARTGGEPWKAWVPFLNEAEVFQDDSAAEAALKAADASVQDRTVVNPYLFDVRREAGALRPVKEREVIRAAGPSVRRDLGKQSTEAFDVSL